MKIFDIIYLFEILEKSFMGTILEIFPVMFDLPLKLHFNGIFKGYNLFNQILETESFLKRIYKSIKAIIENCEMKC